MLSKWTKDIEWNKKEIIIIRIIKDTLIRNHILTITIILINQIIRRKFKK